MSSAVSILRRLLFLGLATITTGLAFAVLELLLTDVGAMQLLGIREHGFLGFGVIVAWLGSLVTWYVARDVAIGSTGTQMLAEKEWLDLVASLARPFGFKHLPELGVYNNASLNAFAVGRSKNHMLLCLSQGLVTAGVGPEAELILTHQLARMARGDVVTQTLIQGFVSIFTLFPTRIFATFLGTSLRTAEDETPTDAPEGLMVSALEMLLTPYTSLLVRFYARGAEAAGDLVARRVLGDARVAKGMTAIIATKGSQPYREIFVLPLKFTGQPKAAMNLLLFHGHLPQRLALLGAPVSPGALVRYPVKPG